MPELLQDPAGPPSAPTFGHLPEPPQRPVCRLPGRIRSAPLSFFCFTFTVSNTPTDAGASEADLRRFAHLESWFQVKGAA